MRKRRYLHLRGGGDCTSSTTSGTYALVQNLSQENEFDLHENKPVGGTHFHMKWFRTKIRFDTGAKDNSEMAYFQQCIY